MSKNIAGINILSRQQFGESQYLSKYSNQLVELMKPVALQANKSLYSEEYSKIATQMQALVSAGVMDKATAERLTNSTFEMYMNPYGTVSNGSTYQKMVGINTIASGGIDSPSSWISNAVNGVGFGYGLAGGNSFTASTIYNKWGMPVNNRNVNLDKMDEAQALLAKIGTMSDEEIEQAYGGAVSSADDYNTNTDKFNKAIINATDDIGEIKTAVTNKGWEIAEMIVKGITTYIGAKIIGGVIGKSAGIIGGSEAGGSGVGIMSGLGIAGTVGLTVGLTTAALVGIGKAMQSEYNNVSDREANEYSEKWANSSDPNVKKWAKNKAMTSAAGQSSSQVQQGWFGETMSNVGGGFSTMWSNLTSGDYIKKNKNFYEWMASSGVFSEDENVGTLQRLAAYFLWDKAGSLASVSGNVTRSDLEQIAKEGYNLKAIQKYADSLVKAGWAPSNKYKEKVTSTIDFASYGAPEGSYRQGLNEVPYDNFLANLHEGEAILTASTANELRNLLDEYRANNQTSANLDAIIQQQTNDLCTKLDEVVVAISRINLVGNITTSSSDQAKAQSILKNSMLHMISTKNALN